MNDSRPWWLWPNLLSLDAPAVAIIWQRFLAASAGVPVPIDASVALGLIVWSIYLLDRLLDNRDTNPPETDRHRFARSHPRTVAILALVAGIAGATVGVRLPEAYLETGMTIAGVATAYFGVIHVIRSKRSGAGLKELFIGVVFATGVAIPLLSENSSKSPGCLAGVGAFAGLCALNCLVITWWEETNVFSPRWILLGGIAVAAIAGSGAARPVAVAVISSLSCLGALAIAQEHMSVRALRVLADVALLTPLLVILP